MIYLINVTKIALITKISHLLFIVMEGKGLNDFCTPEHWLLHSYGLWNLTTEHQFKCFKPFLNAEATL